MRMSLAHRTAPDQVQRRTTLILKGPVLPSRSMRRPEFWAFPLLLALVSVVLLTGACSSSDPAGPDVGTDPCARVNVTSASRFPGGSPDGHADPAGAKAAHQARAGRIKDASLVRMHADVRNRTQIGDILLINDKVSATIEGVRDTDGYAGIGGKIVALEPVGDDGLPVGISTSGETLIALSRQLVVPDSVTVLNDGSDGKAAVVRATGMLGNVGFFDSFAGLFPDEYDLPAAIDYSLEPGSEKIAIKLSLMNVRDEDITFIARQNFAFFQFSRSDLFTSTKGFATPKDDSPFVAFDGGRFGFAFRQPGGAQISAGLGFEGFQLFQAKGLSLTACETKSLDYVEIIPGGPGLDGILSAIRRVDGDASYREVHGKVTESDGTPIVGALVHAVDGDRYLSRTTSGVNGEFVIHVPPGNATLVPTFNGFTIPAPTPVGAGDVTLAFAPRGTLVVHAREAGTLKPIPVRIQVIPTTPPTLAPESWGVKDPGDKRLYREFALNGDATLAIPPGQHRVVVTRGYEWELSDTLVDVVAGQTFTVDATLAHSVDSTGVMCADFHIHSFYSADSSDPVVTKVKSAIADGLEIPVSSEHEWVIDFQPIVQELGMTDWAFGMPSEELTTFEYGHFGVIPKYREPEKRNMGVVTWVRTSAPDVFRAVSQLPENPVLIVNHPYATGVGGYFGSASFDKATAKGTDGIWSEQFGAIEVFNATDSDASRASSIAAWMALLNAGKTMWATGSSDSHHIRSAPVGYPRNCLRFGHDDPKKLTPEIVRDTLRQGASVVSGGLTMTVEGPGGIGPGGTAVAGAYKVTVRSPSWIAASTLDTIVDGVTTGTLNLVETPGPGPERKYEATVDVAPLSSSARHWVVFHAKGPAGKDLEPLHPGKIPFAVSNPIFF